MQRRGWHQIENPSPALMAEAAALLTDMRERHPCRRILDTWTEACEVPVSRSPSPVAAQAAPDAPDRGMGSGVEQWRGLVSSYFPASEVDTALRVMACESGGNPNADNPRSSATGLMQVLASLWAPHFGISQADLYDPVINMRIARAIWDQSGWNAWSCY